MKRDVLVRRAIVLACAVALGGLSDAASAQQTTMKIATVVSGDNPRNIAANELARQLAARSGGKIKGEVYINNQLAKGEAAQLEATQLGTIDMGPVGAAPIGGIFEPGFLPLSLPFLWPSRQHVWKAMDGPVGAELATRMAAKGLKTLCYGGGWGYRNVMSNKRPIRTPADMKGITIRVQQSPVYIGMMKALGANPVPMPWTEVFLALKQGTVDAMEAPAVSIVSDKYHEIGKYYSLTKHTYEPVTWYMNKKKYDALAPDLKQAVDTAAKDACALDRKAEVESEEGDLATIRKAGVQVNDIADLKPFRDMMGPVYQEIGAKVGKEWLDKVLAAAK
ncbi:MAG TPA: TRAP transporter substrate-binding protein [Burkholderiales bacterium]|nr:TRAP transporter substrate-binding protein [Burkholderiales bacterium]